LAHRESVCAAARGGPVLDLACGRGRHTLVAADWGAHAIGADRDPAALADLEEAARARGLRADAVRTDIERPGEIPFADESCGAILVFRFLFRPLAPTIESLLRPGGLLLYETFTERQRELTGGPRRAAFLLAAGELPALFPGLEVIESWEGVTDGPHPAALARLAARRPSAP
jgi:SAM-dependent methyltransferase